MDPDDAVLLTDVVPTGYQAAEMGGIQPGDTVVVFGAGPVGIMAARCCLVVWRRPRHHHRPGGLPAGVRQKLRPCEAYNFNEMEDPVVFVKKATDWLGADVCIDAVGAEAAGNALQTITGRSCCCRPARPRPCTGPSTR